MFISAFWECLGYILVMAIVAQTEGISRIVSARLSISSLDMEHLIQR
jgi:hypothetical protein